MRPSLRSKSAPKSTRSAHRDATHAKPKPKNRAPSSKLHAVKAGSSVEYNTGGHATRGRTTEYAHARRALVAIVETLGPSWYFAEAREPLQDHHGGGLWLKDAEGWFFVRNLVGIEWSGQFCADPKKVDVLRANAKRLYAAFPAAGLAFAELGIDLNALLDTPIRTAADVARWTDSICNASVPLPQRLHTGAIPKGGGVHNYPTPVTDIDRFRYDDFTLWVTDDEGQPAAVVPTNRRGEPGRDVEVVHATAGTKLHAKLVAARKKGKALVAKETHAIAKKAFARVR